VVVQKERRAIGADDLRLVPHIEIDVRVIERRRRPHALELLDADPDPVDALVVHQMRHEGLGHEVVFVFRVQGSAASIVSLEAKR
jgi:UTP-glucose-1-phosphate uridylyltransferase